jgi:drug/metabolite transporter (DMT)-like permease
MGVSGEPIPSLNWYWIVSALSLGAASAAIQLTMNWAQRSVSATRATVIYAGEPVWGGIVGWCAGERLTPAALMGAALILVRLLVSEMPSQLASGIAKKLRRLVGNAAR